jgi:hypothetical protein
MLVRAGNRAGDVASLGALVLAALLLLSCLPGAVSAKPSTVRPWLASFVLEPESGPYAQYGYAPEYTRNVPVFDSLDRPYIRSRTSNANYTSYVHTMDGTTWERRGLLPAVRAAYPDFAATVGAGGSLSDRVVFDSADRAYTPLTIRLRDGSSRNLLLYSLDLCRTWSVVDLPPGRFVTETWTGHNDLDGPPFLAFWVRTGYSGEHRSQVNTVWVTQPYVDGDAIVVPEPTFVTSTSLGLSRISGGSSFAATRDGTTFFTWPEATPEGDGGVPIMVAAYDHASRTVGPAVQLARVRPDDDLHVKPGVCLDSQGYLHVVTGAHGGPFQYTRSREPLRVDAGWTDPEPVLEDGYADAETGEREGRQTYLSLVCDARDTLHIVFRQWRQGCDPYHRGFAYGALAYQRKAPGRPWSPAHVIVVAADPGYSIFYHKLGMDHGGRLFLAVSYKGGDEIKDSNDRLARWRILAAQEVQQGQYRRRMVLMSDDRGGSWRLATTADFAAGIDAAGTGAAGVDAAGAPAAGAGVAP